MGFSFNIFMLKVSSVKSNFMKRLFMLVLFCMPVIAGYAQFPITMTGEPISTTGWTYGGSGTGVAPSTTDSVFHITSAVEGEANYVYYNTPAQMDSFCQVQIDFDFQVIVSTGTPVADGFAFWCLSTPPSSTVTGSAIGLPNYANGLILLFDTYDNNSTPDNPIETLLGYNGTIYQYVEDAPAGQLCSNLNNQNYVTNGLWHHVKITYASGSIAVYYNYSATATQTGTYTLTGNRYFGFSGSTGLYYSQQNIKNVHIVANGTSSVPAVTSPVTYCQGATSDTLTATSTGFPLHWYTTDTATVTSLPSSPTPATTTAGSTYYFVRQGSGLCISQPDSILVNVSALPPAPSISGDTFYCAGSTAVPFTVTGSGIEWYTTDTGTIGSTTAPTASTGTAGYYTYYAASTVAGCTGPMDSITVHVQALPASPTLTGGSLTYCQYAPFVPLTVSGTDVLWYAAPPPSASADTAPVINTAIAGSHNYYVTQTVDGCTSNPLLVPVTVNPKPAPPATTPATYCQFTSATPMNATGSALEWYGPGVTTGYATAPTPSTTTPGVITYYVTQTISGCTSDSATVAATITAQPAPPVTADTTYCQFATSVPLTATGSNLQWYTAATGGISLPGAPTPPTATPGNTTWYVTQTVNGCESNRAPEMVTIIFMPNFTITTAKPFICQYDSMVLTYSGTPASYYDWVLPAGDDFAAGYNSGMSAVMVKFDQAAQHNYVYLTAGGPTGQCRTTDTLDIKVVPQPTADAMTKFDPCIGDTLNLALANESANADSFTWAIDNTPMSSSSVLNIVSANANTGGPFKISWNTVGVHTIELQTFTAEGCASKIIVDTVKVLGFPDATFTYHPLNGQLCVEDSILFQANDSSYSDLYEWTPTHFFNNLNTHDVWGKVEESAAEVTLTVINANGCTTSSSMEINPATCCVITFPSAFSPNGDTHNDVFRPIASGYHRFHSFRIENRWGQTVFETTEDKAEWDGTYNGVPQDMGVYYYYLTYDCGGQSLNQKGDVTLVR